MRGEKTLDARVEKKQTEKKKTEKTMATDGRRWGVGQKEAWGLCEHAGSGSMRAL